MVRNTEKLGFRFLRLHTYTRTCTKVHNYICKRVSVVYGILLRIVLFPCKLRPTRFRIATQSDTINLFRNNNNMVPSAGKIEDTRVSIFRTYTYMVYGEPIKRVPRHLYTLHLHIVLVILARRYRQQCIY